ncbi:hypothetical protein JCM11641_007269, partial [Rhodosporidiobolus odoratus]
MFPLDEDEAEDEDELEPAQVRYHPSAARPCTQDGEWLSYDAPAPAPPVAEHDTNVFEPFEDERQFRWARVLESTGMSESDIEALMCLMDEEPLGAPFKSKRDMMALIDSVGTGTQPLSPVKLAILTILLVQIRIGPVVFYKRDAREVLVHLVEDVRFKNCLQLKPIRVIDENRKGKGEGQYTVSDPVTASEAWDFQDTLPVGSTAIRVDTAQDSTLCSTATGGATEHPVYLTTPAIPGIYRRGDYGAHLPIAFLPKFKRTGKGKDELYRRYKRIVRHKCMSAIYEPLRRLLNQGEILKFADGHYRQVRIYFGPTAVDYPEATWMNCLSIAARSPDPEYGGLDNPGPSFHPQLNP